MCQCVRILVEEYGENKQRRREHEQCHCEPDQTPAVLVGGDADDCENASEFVQHAHGLLSVVSWILGAFQLGDDLPHLIEKLCRTLLKIVLRLHGENCAELLGT
jgi:hypothetical protein